MADKNPIEFTGKVLDERNTLSGPDDRSYPERPKHVKIQQTKNNTQK